MEKTRPEYSLVVTCYFEEKSIREFYHRAKQVLDSLEEDYEIIFINDGSTDETWQRLMEIFDADEHVSHSVDLARNYGQGTAIGAGIELAAGKTIVYMDSDLQLDPEDLPLLLEEYRKGDYDIIKGRRKHRHDPWLRRICSRMANRLIPSRTGCEIRDVGCTYLVFPRSLAAQIGFGATYAFSKMKLLRHSNRVVEVGVNHHARRYGASGQSVLKLWSMNMENVVHLSDKPFQVIGIAALIGSGAFMLRIIAGFLFGGKLLAHVSNGLLLNVITMTFLFNLGVLCLIGEFAIRSFMQSEGDVQYVIREKLSR